ncbi:MAG: hypothetical protein WBG46_04100 [Nonlabens sp.]
MKFYNSNNIILFNVLAFLEIVVLYFLYREKFKKAKWLYFLSGGALLYIAIEAFMIDQSDIATFQTYSRIVSSFVIAIMVLNYLFTELREGSILKNDTLHFVILFYYSIEFMLLIPFNFLINSSITSIMYIWTARIFLNFILYSYLTYFIWRSGKILK